MESDTPTLIDAGAAPRDGPAPGRLGRYLVLEELGRGGMGAVFRAYDPELDRPVAIKVLAGERDEGERQARLLREAQALARLSHPNVVAVHDVGLIDGRVYVAMEHVQGQSLRTWLEAPRPWPAIVAVFAQAGRGLAAAPAAGRVLPAFKPANVMVGADGRVRVLDFGLAALAHRVAAVGPAPPLDPGALAEAVTMASRPRDDTHSRSLLESRLTQAGSRMGTLAYMSPEQFDGAELDARTDQFSFCAALYEALYRQRPFVGDTAAEYALAVAVGAVRPPPRRTTPRWLHRLVTRGLSRAPEARHPDMNTLLAELERDRGAWRRRLAVAGLGAGAALAGALVAWPTAARCASAEQAAAVWDATRGEAVAAAFAATGLPYASDAAARVLPRLDAYAARWAAARDAACEAHARGERSDSLYDRQVACLQRRLDGLAARAAIFARADATAVENAIAAAEDLAAPEDCEDPARLLPEALIPEDPERARAVADARVSLAAADAEDAAGHFSAARDAAREVASAARALDDAALLAEALETEGAALIDLAEYVEARARLLEALWTAVAVDHVEVSLRASSQLLSLASSENHDRGEAALFRDHALALLRRARAERTDDHVSLLSALSKYAVATGDPSGAYSLAREATALAVSLVGHESFLATTALHAEARALHAARDFDAAIARFRETREVALRVLGPTHPFIAVVTNNLAMTLDELELVDEAEAEFTHALALVRAAIGPDAIPIAFMLSNLSDIYARKDRLDDAEAAAREAHTILRRELGPDHPRSALTLLNHAATLQYQGRYAEALPELEEAAAVYARTYGPDHHSMSDIQHRLGLSLLNGGEPVRALPLFEESLRITTRAVGADHVDTAADHRAIGETLLALGRPAEALAALDRALARIPAQRLGTRAAVQFHRARARWALGERTAARAEAEEALAVLRGGHGTSRVPAAAVEAWLAGLPPRRGGGAPGPSVRVPTP